jgi:arginase
MDAIKFIEVDSELGAGTRGASLGIRALKTAALNLNIDIFSRISSISVPTSNHLLHEPITTPFGLHIEGIAKLYANVCHTVKEVITKEKKLPVVLSGDHSAAGGTIAGLRAAFPGEKVGVVWIDAHADLHSPYTTPSGNVHGMPLAAALAQDNKENQRNDIKGVTLQAWEKMKNVCAHSPWITPEELILVGVRDTEPEEDFLIEKLNIHNISVSECRSMGFERSGVQILQYLQHCDRIYVSFDVDSMDPDLVSDGTGTPVADGFLPEEVGDMVAVLVEDPRFCCFEIVEINPTLDSNKNSMAEAALKVLQTVVSNVRQS